VKIETLSKIPGAIDQIAQWYFAEQYWDSALNSLQSAIERDSQ